MKPNHCPVCQSPIPENAPGGFCPVCILRDADEVPASGPNALSVSEIAAAFPQLEEISLIGQGGMGFVYKARQPKLDRTIALKILAPVLSGDPAFAERFAREARTLGKLQHPNIVTVFEHGISQPSSFNSQPFFYLMMEYVDGVNLRQAMRAGRFTPPQALAIVPGICDALQYAHEQGVWHRDIKPENILLDREGRVKIADFGIARIVGDPQRDFTLTMTGNALGSAAYMAPEQHEKPHDVDHRADIYSLGVVIYEMLTGELPLGRFPSPSQRAKVDARIDEIVLQTLEKERELRQQSASEVKTDVFRAMQPGGSRNVPAASESSGMAKLACGLLLAGVLGTPLLMGVLQKENSAVLFGVIAVLLALILGLMCWRERLGKFVVIASGFLGALSAVWLLWISGPIRMRREPPETTITQKVQADPVNERIVPPRIPMQPTRTLRRIVLDQPAPMPSVSPEEVFRKAVAAANESNSEEFKSLMWVWTFSQDPLVNKKVFAPGPLAENPVTLVDVALFAGEIVNLRIVSIDKTRVPAMSSYSDYAGNYMPLAYATLRKPDGTVNYLAVTFRNKNGHWVGTEAWTSEYRAYSRIEFKPEKGDATTILKAHLGADIDFRAVEGMPNQFDVLGFYSSAENAKDESDKRVKKLRESLEKFNLDKDLKVISPAEKPDVPYMGEDLPSFTNTATEAPPVKSE